MKLLRTIFGIVAVLILIALLVIFVIIPTTTSRDNIKQNPIIIDYDSNVIVKNGFKLTPKYLGDSKWSYKLKGSLPNQCYTIKVDSLIRESFPEQIVVNVLVTAPKPDVMCTQAIFEFEKDYEVSANEKATFELNVTVK